MKYTSVKTVIAKIVSDIGEWNKFDYNYMIEKIMEVLAKLRTREMLCVTSMEVQVEDFKYEIPCDLIKTIAITNNNGRLYYSNTKGDLIAIARSKEQKQTDADVIYQSQIEVQIIKDANGDVTKRRYDTSRHFYNNLVPIVTSKTVDDSYYENGNHFNFSFEEGPITIHYLSLLLDDENMPLIPDLTAVHEAMYYYVLLKMIGRGFKHPIFQGLQGLDYLQNQYRHYMGLAKSQINMPSLDQMESYIHKLVNLMPNHSSWIKLDIESERSKDRLTVTSIGDSRRIKV